MNIDRNSIKLFTVKKKKKFNTNESKFSARNSVHAILEYLHSCKIFVYLACTRDITIEYY